jgi:RNA-binding protein
MLYHLLRPPPPQTPPPLLPPPSSFFSWFLGLKPLLISTTTTATTTTATLSKPLLQTPLRKTTHFAKSLSPLFCHSFSTLATSLPLPNDPSPSLQNPDEEEDEGDDEEEIEEFDGEVESGSEELEAGGREEEGSRVMGVGSSSSSLPSLSVKEKKELASYAHSLGKKLKSQLVGKSGVTANVVSSFIETLESNELLKVPTFAINNFVCFTCILVDWLVVW